MICTHLRELYLQMSLLYFHYDVSNSTLVKSCIWTIIVANIVAYEILMLDNHYKLRMELKFFAFALILVVFLIVVFLSIFQFVVAYSIPSRPGKLDRLKPVLGFAYACSLGISTLLKYSFYIIFQSLGFGNLLAFAVNTFVDAAVVVLLSIIHSRLCKLDSILSQVIDYLHMRSYYILHS